MEAFYSMLAPDRILLYPSSVPDADLPSKERLLGRLSEAVARGWERIDGSAILDLALKREATLSTRLSDRLAVPHAVVPGTDESRLAVAVLGKGIEWDTDREHPVRLVVLLAGSAERHLKLLSELARLLEDERLLRELLESPSPDRFIELLRRYEERPPRPYSRGEFDLSAEIFRQGLLLKEKIGATRLILHADAIESGDYIGDLIRGHQVMLVTSSGRFDEEFNRRFKPVVMPLKGVRRSTHVQFTLLYLLGKGLIGENDLIVNVFGRPGSGFLDSIRISHLKRELDLPFAAGTGNFPPDLELSAFTRVLQLSTQLALEGREGKPVGTLFVVGNYDGVGPYTRQMIINPFHGYRREERNILDPGIEETVKEYARIDGAFIVAGDGTIESAGTFLSGQPTADEMQSGLGARHAAAQGITAVSRALAVAVSESTRKVSVF